MKWGVVWQEEDIGERRGAREGLFLSGVVVDRGWRLVGCHHIISEPDLYRAGLAWNGQADFVQGELKEQPARGSGEELLLPITVIQESVDANIRYEEETESVLVTTSESVFRMKMESTKGELNGKAVTIPYAPKLIDGIAYVPIKPLKQHYGVTVHEDSATGAIILMRAGIRFSLPKQHPVILRKP